MTKSNTYNYHVIAGLCVLINLFVSVAVTNRVEPREGKAINVIQLIAFFFPCTRINGTISYGSGILANFELQHIHKSYGDVKAVDDVSIRLKETSFIVLAGPSGCGKSTLLQCIAGILPMDSGCVMLNGEDMTQLEPGKRNIAMVFQNAALFPHLNVYDNIALGLKKSGYQENEINDMVLDIVKPLGIDTLLMRKADTLSGGQQQRVAIARALVRKPALFLMDEPLSSLDAALKTQLRIEIAQLYQKQDATFLYVTHDQMEAMTLASTLVIMKDGRIQQAGNPQEIYRNPVNLFTASFLGKYKLNLFEGEVKEKVLYCKHKRKFLSEAWKDQLLYVGVRMEHIYEDDGGIIAKIVLIEDVGDEIYYHLSIENQILIMKGMLRSHELNEDIRISFHWENALFFDKHTEERLFIG